MILLIRDISPYTGPALLLGAFNSPTQAREGRKSYIISLKHRPDPWSEQAYKKKIDLEEDVKLVEVPVSLGRHVEDGAQVFVISAYFDSFGMIVRHFKSIADNEPNAASETRRLAGLPDSNGACFLIQKICIGAIISDAPENQPRTF